MANSMLLSLTAGLLMALPTVYNQRQRVESKVQWINQSSGYCLDTDGRAVNGGAVRTWECANHPNQLWQVQTGGNFGYQVKNVATGLCLDTNGRGENGGVVRMWTCANHANQIWEIGARFKNVASGFCLDTDGRAVNGGAVRMWECAVHNNQGWRYRKEGEPGLGRTWGRPGGDGMGR